jgi:hypothetical protein
MDLPFTAKYGLKMLTRTCQGDCAELAVLQTLNPFETEFSVVYAVG